MTRQWVLLYSEAQDAYHIEPAREYQAKPHNGYALKTEGTREYCERYLAFLLAARRVAAAMVEVGGKAL